MFENKYNPLAWIRGVEKNYVTIEEDVWIGPFCVVDGEYDTVFIGRGVNLSSGAQIVSHDTVKRCLTGRVFNEIEHAPVIIENNVYVGTNAVILKGCKIGHHSIIAAGSVVKENTVIPPYSLVAGVPAIIKKNIESDYLNWLENEHSI